METTKTLETLSQRINAMTNIQRYRLEWYLTGIKPDYVRGYDDATEAAIEWLNANWRKYIDQDGDGMIRFGGWKEDFRKAMEE